MNRKTVFSLLLITCATQLAFVRLQADELVLKFDNVVTQWIKGSFQEDPKVESIDIGTFQCVGEYKESANQASGGMEITRRLKEAFENKKFRVSDKAIYIMRGNYQLKKDEKSSDYKLVVSLEMMEKGSYQSLMKYSLDVELKAPELIAKLTGMTTQISGATNQQRLVSLNRAIEAPKPPDGNAGSVVKPAPDSDFGMEILVKNREDGQYMARGTRIQGGQPFIQLNKGDVYSVRLYNHSKEPAAVELLLDGLSTLALNDDKNLREGRYILLPGETTEIKAWTVNNEPLGAHEFTIGAIDDAIAARQLPPERIKIGLISATFARAWDANNPPDDIRRGTTIKDSPDGVANVLGNLVEQRLHQVNYEFMHPSAFVSIRYSSQPPADLPGK